MEENWKVVYTADRFYKAELVQGLLKENGIESIVMNKEDSEFLVGTVELYVDEADFEKAEKIVAEHHPKHE